MPSSRCCYSTSCVDIFLESESKAIAAEQEIFTNYINIKKPRSQRLKELKQLYYFDCQCARCSTGEEERHVWNGIRELNERMDALIDDKSMSEETKYRDIYLLGIQTLPLYE